MVRAFLIVGVFVLFCIHLIAQSTYLPLGTYGYHVIDRLEIKSGKINSYLFSAVKPYSRKGIARLIESSDASSSRQDQFNTRYLKLEGREFLSVDDSLDSKKSLLKYLYQDPSVLYAVNTKDFMFKINPVLYAQGGQEQEIDEFKYINTRGIEFRGMIDEKIGFYTFVSENQVFFPEYVKDRTEQDQAVQGQGFYKTFKDEGVDFFNARGYITFPVTKHVGVQFGHDKNFIGNGYRSLILSDYANNYLFLKLNTKVWRLNYQNLYTSLVADYTRGVDTKLPNKYMSLHHLSLNVTDWLNIGAFESVVSGRLDANYLNPIIFYRAVEQDLGSPDNAILGTDFKVNFLKHFSCYGQFIVDEFNFNNFRDSTGWWGNKYGFQAGLKYIDVAGISNLDLQLEYNVVRPYTYTFRDSLANYSHYNQSLAHPLGANFEEFIGIIRYQPIPRLTITARQLVMNQGIDTANTNWGGSVFPSYITREREYDNYILQGVFSKTFLTDITLSYQWRHNIFLDLRYLYRTNNLKTNNTSFTSFAVRMNIAQWDWGY